MQTPLIPHQDHDDADNGGQKPQQHVDEVDPHGVLHAFDPAVALWVFVDVEVAEGAEDGGP